MDTIVIGLGAHGSAAAYQLAKRGASVLGLEQFPRGHTLGSSGGLSRIIRLAYYEHPGYVPLLRRAWDLWRALEQESGETLLTATGGLYAGAPEVELMTGSLASARTHSLAHEVLDAVALRARFPLLEWPSNWIGLHEQQAGWLAPERCIETHLRLAERHGARLRFEEPVERWETTESGIRVTTARGSFDARRLVIAAGAWLPRLLPLLAPHLWVERNVLFWLEPRDQREAFATLPVYIVEEADGFFYGFPYDAAHGLKVAGLHHGERVDPKIVDRGVHERDERRVRGWVRRRIPLADGPRREAKVCLYTVSPDSHFVIDALPDRPQVVFASACSGHGFKFASVVGEILADLALEGRTAQPIGFLSLGRLAVTAPSRGATD